MKMKKKLSKYLAGLLVAVSIMSIGTVAKAAYVEDVLYRWQEIGQDAGDAGIIHYTTNQQYKRITFVNGYDYTQSSENVTSFMDRIGGIFSRIQYTRNYRTY